MPSIPLPENASLEHLKKQAKLVQEFVRSGADEGLALVREFHPRFDDISSRVFKRADAQLVVARLYGFASWAKIGDHLSLVREHAQRSAPEPTSPPDLFVDLACVSYSHGDPCDRIDQAEQMLESDPGLGISNVAALAATGEQTRLAEMVATDPNIVNDPCGPNRWPPLLYCAYSRVQSRRQDASGLATAQVLLDAGADPNAGFLWQGLVPPFTALTGAFGRGEADQPPHRDATAFAQLLLDAGADPNDGQTLYNNGLAGTAHDDAAHLELLVEHGLGTDTSGPWYKRFGSQLTPPEELLYGELEVAALRGLPRRMRFLLGLGLDVERRVGRSQLTPRELARRHGHTEVLDALDGIDPAEEGNKS